MGSKHSIYLGAEFDRFLVGGRASLQVQRLCRIGLLALEAATPCLSIAEWVRCLRVAQTLLETKKSIAPEAMRAAVLSDLTELELQCVGFVAWRYWIQDVQPGESLSARLLAAGARFIEPPSETQCDES